jgi:hypothetical protein
MISELVTWRFKLVALMLIVGLFGSPLMAVASCRLTAVMAGCWGCKHCPLLMTMQMHAGQTPTHQVSVIPSANTCYCRGSRVPGQASKAVITTVEKAPAQLLSAQAVIAVLPVLSSPAEAPPLAERPSCLSRAVLCSFLI